MSSCNLALTIPNPDWNFSSKQAKLIEDHLFIITKRNEILVYEKREDKINNVSYFEKKFIILTTLQDREESKRNSYSKRANYFDYLC